MVPMMMEENFRPNGCEFITISYGSSHVTRGQPLPVHNTLKHIYLSEKC